MLSPGLISYQRTMRRASRQPSSFRLPSMTIGPLARVIEYVSPLVDVCALAGVAVMTIAAATAVLKTHRPDISSPSGRSLMEIRPPRAARCFIRTFFSLQHAVSRVRVQTDLTGSHGKVRPGH